MDTSDAGHRRRRRHSAEFKAAVMAARRHSGRKCRRARLRPTAKATDYSLTRWTALTRNVGDGNLPADNNWIENRIRPIALGRVLLFRQRRQRSGHASTEPSAAQAQTTAGTRPRSAAPTS